MKQGKKFAMLLLFAFVGLLTLIGMTASVGGERHDNISISIKHQAVLRLIDHFADPDCAEAVDEAQAKTTFDHPVPECWLVSEARTILEDDARNEK